MELADRLAKLSPEKRALLDKRLKERAEPPAGAEPVAIIGMACRFPGAPNPEAFWQLVERGGDAIGEVPASRWDANAVYDSDTSRAGTTNSRYGGFVDGIDQFDASFFGIAPREAARMDPQQRLFLEVAWEALEDAGQDVEALSGSDTGVFVGLHSHANDYFWFDLPNLERMDAYTGPGTSHNMVAGRLSYLFDFQGPAMVIDTACSSSLVAIHVASQSLRNRECSLALAGGVNLVLSPVFTIALSRLGMLSPDGHCRTFDAGANGFVRSEGCGVIALKRLADARAAGDRVLAVIGGSAVNQDGRTNGITAPSSPSQQRVITRALAHAGVDAAQIGYIEAHGTGTELGDPIEVEALSAVVGTPAKGAPCFLGSAKANVGHLEGAAGVAGVIKAVLALQHRTIPPLALFRTLNPHISLAGTRLSIPVAAEPWNADRRIAGVSSFGWSGTNAHMVIEEAPAELPPQAAAMPAVVLPISARSDAAARELAGAYAALLTSRPEDVPRVCAAAAVRRTHHDFRVAVAGASARDLSAALADYAAGKPAWNLAVDRAVAGRKAPVVFVFSGQGPQWPGMGQQLLAENAAFRGVIEQVSALLEPLAGWSLLSELAAEPARSRLQDTAVAQPALFALQVGLAAAFKAFGIEPAAVVGHSIGEVAASHVSGALSLAEAVRVVFHRGRIMQQATGHGRMVAVELPQAEVEAAIGRDAALVSVASVNAPLSCVLSGEPSAVEAIIGRLESAGVICRPLPVNYAFHSVQMEGPSAELQATLGAVARSETHIPLISTVTGDVLTGSALDAEYWGRNVRSTVRFARAISTLQARGHHLFLELAPHPVLASSIRACGRRDSAATAVASLQRGKHEPTALMAAIGALYVKGHPLNWRRVYESAAPLPLPRYPFQRARYWLPGSGPVAAAPRVDRGSIETAVPAARTPAYTEQWVPAGSDAAPVTVSRGTWVIVGDRSGFSAALANRMRAVDGPCLVIEPDQPLSDSVLQSAAPLAGIVCTSMLDATAAAGDGSERLLATLRRDGGRVLEVVQRAVAGGTAVPVLYLLTRHAQAAADPARQPLQATVWGLSRIVALEHPELRCVCVDIDTDTSAEAVLGELKNDGGELEIALRGGRRLVRRLARAEVASRELRVDADATYLVTGGLGSLGLAVAERLVDRGARHLVLVGRRAPAGPSVSRIAALEARGVRAVVQAADVAARADVDRVVAGIADSMPALKGVVHAAGVLDDGVIVQQRWDRFEQVMRPKVAGTWNLHEATRHLPLDFFVMFSAAATSLGSPGQANYAAANAFMDALARVRRAAQLPALSINWGPWADGGMADTVSADTQRRWRERGMRFMSPGDALGFMERLISGDECHVTVADMDWERVARAQVALPPALRLLVGDAPRMAASAQVDLVRVLGDTAPVRRLAVLTDHVHQQSLGVLGLPGSYPLDAHQGLRDVGLDSLMAVELRNRLQASIRQPLPTTLAFDCPTVAALTRHLASVLRLDLGDTTDGGGSVESADADAAAVRDLSDQEALAALNAEFAAFNAARERA